MYIHPVILSAMTLQQLRCACEVARSGFSVTRAAQTLHTSQPAVSKLLRSLEKHLYREYGPLLLYPAYKQPDADIGYLTRYTPGARENGGLYPHAGVWAIQAECALGRSPFARNPT